MTHTKSLLTLLAGIFVASACSKWTDTEIKNPTSLVGSNKSEEYYEALRAYKQTDHEVAFGWFSGWSGSGSSLQSSMAGLPDSVDFISMWGGWKNPSAEQLKDLRFVQQVKGTRALVCFLVLDIGGQLTPDITAEKKKEYAAQGIGKNEMYTKWRHEFWGWSTANTAEGKAARIAAAEKYANAVCDTIDKYGYDGFDLDAEPSYAHPFGTAYELWRAPGNYEEATEPIMAFVRTMGKRIGPRAETETGRKKLFVVDGEPEQFGGEMATYFNYYIHQAYGDGLTPANYRFEEMVEAFAPLQTAEEIAKKWIITVNFESYASTGGSPLGQLLSFAAWEPTYEGVKYRKGGIGSFRMDLEYRATPPDVAAGYNMKDVQGTTYPWTRKAIQIMNPVIY